MDIVGITGEKVQLLPTGPPRAEIKKDGLLLEDETRGGKMSFFFTLDPGIY